MSRILPELFAAAVRRDGGAPFLTYYDDATGERIELSTVTTANWVAKTANLLVDEYDLESGETVAIGLPPHWLGVVWALSTWSVGASLTTGTGTLAITGPDFAIRGDRETVASALLPLGGRFREPLPDGIHDYGAEVYNHADVFVPFEFAGLAPRLVRHGGFGRGYSVGSQSSTAGSAPPVSVGRPRGGHTR